MATAWREVLSMDEVILGILRDCIQDPCPLFRLSDRVAQLRASGQWTDREVDGVRRAVRQSLAGIVGDPPAITAMPQQVQDCRSGSFS